MDDLAILELLARGGAVGAFLGLAIIVIRGGTSPARVTGALFALAAASHTLTQWPGEEIDRALLWLWPPIWMFSVMGGGLFWAFARELFEDRARLSPFRFAPAALLLAVGAGIAFAAAPQGFMLAHNILSAGFIAHALFIVAMGWRGDLVEARRRLRGPILAIAAIYALAVLFVQTGELFLGSAEGLSPLAALALLLLSLLSLAGFGRADPSLFGPAKNLGEDEEYGEPEPAAEPQLTGEDAATVAALDRLMRNGRLYREEGLTISSLAIRLRTPEHRLRRLINQGLGHRNFSAFLNQWRLADAKGALSDASQASVPISTIALDAGFGSLGPFNRAFKAETGQTPTEFRAQVLGGAGAAAASPQPSAS